MPVRTTAKDARAVGRGHRCGRARRPPAGTSSPAVPGAAARDIAAGPRHDHVSRPARSRRARAQPIAVGGLAHRIADLALSRSASILVNSGGMCCTITIGTGKFAGSVGRGPPARSGRPVDVPMARISTGRRCARLLIRPLGPLTGQSAHERRERRPPRREAGAAAPRSGAAP